ncbi:MAG: hypothetical protein IPM42_06715 [Saprospiraceae bacterium]|nr:hypothetical protein [Saprospiraceae bacterium]
MDTGITYKYILIILTHIIIFNGCRSPTVSISPDEYQNIREFKLNYFVNCMKYGFNNSEAFLDLESLDISQMADFPLGINGYQLADSMARITYSLIQNDSINISKRFDYMIGKKRVFGICLDNFESHRLDSLAGSIFIKGKTK